MVNTAVQHAIPDAYILPGPAGSDKANGGLRDCNIGYGTHVEVTLVRLLSTP